MKRTRAGLSFQNCEGQLKTGDAGIEKSEENIIRIRGRKGTYNREATFIVKGVREVRGESWSLSQGKKGGRLIREKSRTNPYGP